MFGFNFINAIDGHLDMQIVNIPTCNYNGIRILDLVEKKNGSPLAHTLSIYGHTCTHRYWMVQRLLYFFTLASILYGVWIDTVSRLHRYCIAFISIQYRIRNGTVSHLQRFSRIVFESIVYRVGKILYRIEDDSASRLQRYCIVLSSIVSSKCRACVLRSTIYRYWLCRYCIANKSLQACFENSPCVSVLRR